MDADDSFDREMANVDWATVYERQAARGDLAARWCDLLDVSAGDPILEIGCGPGHTTEGLVRDGRPGAIYAFDRQRGALEYLQTYGDLGTTPVHLLQGNVSALPVCPAEPTPTLVAFVLHHLREPATAIAALADGLPPESPLLVVEYDPESTGAVGPPPAHRLAPADVREWLSAAGFDPQDTVTLPEELYAIVGRLHH